MGDLTSLITAAQGVLAPNAAPYLVIQTPLGNLTINIAQALASSTGQGQSSILGVPVTYGIGYGVPPPNTLTTNLLIIAAVAAGAILLLK